MSHRHVGHMTLMPQSHHIIAGMLVQALEVASRSLGIDTMSMARFTPFSRGKIVGKAVVAQTNPVCLREFSGTFRKLLADV